MPHHEEKVCDACHERPATHHTCNGNTGESKSLCASCFDQSASPVELESLRSFQKVVRSGKCKYCGAPAIGGCGGLSIPGIMEGQTNLWCEACRLDLVEFNSKPENAIPDFPFDDETKLEQQSRQLADRDTRQQEFMRQRIRERSH